ATHMMPLSEKYRPRTFDELVGQSKAVSRVKALAQRGGLGGKAFWITGQSGTGKTSLARLIAGEVADEFMVKEVDATTLTVAALAELERESQLTGWGTKP